ncbi:hypothetical protein BDV95DRAFT_575697 [Massariosphaeria phaeospora]|uniref:Uncharacterized protein n=1 Tax=Massariosphaeria phaeospora TaxID=100035 RepID=A0A7C8MD72_9PLEO|nr:hypothetical protein BDV95DRAFT_575697 [Massariosphaeria phaeospora]
MLRDTGRFPRYAATQGIFGNSLGRNAWRGVGGFSGYTANANGSRAPALDHTFQDRMKGRLQYKKDLAESERRFEPNQREYYANNPQDPKGQMWRDPRELLLSHPPLRRGPIDISTEVQNLETIFSNLYAFRNELDPVLHILQQCRDNESTFVPLGQHLFQQLTSVGPTLKHLSEQCTSKVLLSQANGLCWN